MATFDELSIGTRVRMYQRNYTDGNPTGTVIVLQDEESNPGKIVGLKLDNHHPKGCSCDGACDKGFGWWSRPENVSILS